MDTRMKPLYINSFERWPNLSRTYFEPGTGTGQLKPLYIKGCPLVP